MKTKSAVASVLIVLAFASAPYAAAQFRWSNPIVDRKGLPETVKHGTFLSPSKEINIGYCIFFPPHYGNTEKRYPVVYILHGGKYGGDERRFLKMVAPIRHLRERNGEPIPLIYVFVNGGAVSYYNYPAKDSMAEDIFIKELIPHVDRTYRTIPEPSGRGIEGYSGGGRAVARIIFKYPQLFGSAIAGCGGYNFEKQIAETGERDVLKDFLPGDNAYDRAKEYAKTMEPKVTLLIAVGTDDPWYETNLDYMSFLEEQKIPFERLIAPDTKHGPTHLYGRVGIELVRFHKRHLAPPR